MTKVNGFLWHTLCRVKYARAFTVFCWWYFHNHECIVKTLFKTLSTMWNYTFNDIYDGACVALLSAAFINTRNYLRSRVGLISFHGVKFTVLPLQFQYPSNINFRFIVHSAKFEPVPFQSYHISYLALGHETMICAVCISIFLFLIIQSTILWPPTYQEFMFYLTFCEARFIK